MNAKTDLKPIKLSNVFVPTEVYYTFAQWPSKDIDGIEFIPVVKSYPDHSKTQTLHYMRKDSLKVVK